MVVGADLCGARHDDVFLVEVDLRVLLLEVHQQVLQQFLVLHEQVQSIAQVFDFLMLLPCEIQFCLDAENLLVLMEYLLEKLKVVELDFGRGGILGGAAVIHLVCGEHALELVGRFATQITVRVAGSIP